ncbi:MAG: urease accessory protein [Candidatus Poriferisodalaceae bacterium]|jgi:urease accessory protein
MRASASVVINAVDGKTYASDVRSEPPFAIRQAGDRFLIVGTAAAPVRGDTLELSIEIAPGITAELGTVAATMVWPGPDPDKVAPSCLATTIRVGAGACLKWRPEPTVSVVGSNHIARTVIDLAKGAKCEVVEEYSLGRSDEPSGQMITDLRVNRDGRTLVRHGECFGPDQPGAGSLSAVARARHVLAAVFVGPDSGESRVEVANPTDLGGFAAAWLPLAADAGLVLAAGPDRPSVLACFVDIRASLGRGLHDRDERIEPIQQIDGIGGMLVSAQGKGQTHETARNA